ncbi:hypothetical protein N9940_00575 [bacterium]|nr:hypothetical protein [Akkermansiaceae bacterium]MDB4296069.1 hypothetical protein [bacterium]MDB4294129.1 hypothetical protein [Akkermansiaceae bacterium]MDB4295114.1 hypothetical protein [Akkermansiaceae bacterium]MDB4323275.1 hypothetical protein [Akkermansiaceae bacterium]
MSRHTHNFRKLPHLLLAGFIFSTTAQAQLTNGLLNYWPLEGDATDVAATTPDTAGVTADNGTINGGVTFVDNTDPAADGLGTGFGMAASFSGTTGDNITMADSAASAAGGVADDIDRTGSDMTVSVWFDVATWSTGWQAVLSHGEGTDYRIARNRSRNTIAGVAGTGDMQPGTSVSAASGWHHVVLTTVNGGDSIMYIDGVEVSRNTVGAAIAASDANNNVLCIGCNPDTGREFNGNIDDIGMWGRALSSTEVKNIYDAGIAGNSLASLFDNGDDDNDGLPNIWEDKFGLDPNSDVGDDGALGDPDGDTLSNFEEFSNTETSPIDKDSDDDNLDDNIETNTGIFNSPTNTGTDPNNPDTDGDTLNDDIESGSGTFVDATNTGSDPNKADTDEDTMPDIYEVDNGLNPNVDDSTSDLDGDLVDNLTEFTNGTDPNNVDSDGDNLNDNVETNTGIFVNKDTDTGTDPLDADSDKDSLLDNHETGNGTFNSETDTGTNPNLGDTDGDGTSDGAEIAAGRNPHVADGLTGGLGQRLVAYWNFDNNLDDIGHNLAGESVVADNGAFTGPETDVFYAADGEGKFGSSALELNGAAGWVTVPASLDTLREAENAVTVSAWAKVPAFTAKWQSLISHGEGAQWRMARSNATTGVAWAGGAGDLSGGELADGEWHHIVGISDPDDFSTKLYVDGVLIATGAAPEIVDAGNAMTPADLFIGSNPQGANREWNGQIDDVAIWGRALTEEEVLSIWAEGNGVSIENLLGGDGPPVITDITYDSDTDEFTLTWTSKVGINYYIYSSSDLIEFSNEVADDIAGEPGSTTSIIANPEPGLDKLFIQVEEGPRPVE